MLFWWIFMLLQQGKQFWVMQPNTGRHTGDR